MLKYNVGRKVDPGLSHGSFFWIRVVPVQVEFALRSFDERLQPFLHERAVDKVNSVEEFSRLLIPSCVWMAILSVSHYHSTCYHATTLESPEELNISVALFS